MSSGESMLYWLCLFILLWSSHWLLLLPECWPCYWENNKLQTPSNRYECDKVSSWMLLFLGKHKWDSKLYHVKFWWYSRQFVYQKINTSLAELPACDLLQLDSVHLIPLLCLWGSCHSEEGSFACGHVSVSLPWRALSVNCQSNSLIPSFWT